MTTIHRTLNRPVPQSKPLTLDQVRNSAGGFVFQIPREDWLSRFLLLGTEGGTFYQSEHEITSTAIVKLHECLAHLGASRYLAEVVHAAVNAPKRTYALYALAVALASEDQPTKLAAINDVPKVVKTGTDFFELISYIETTRGWGETARHALNRILLDKDVQELALWSVKYRERFGWTWRDALRIAHPKRSKSDTQRGLLYDFMLGKKVTTGLLVVDGYLVAKDQPASRVAQTVKQYGLPWEALTDEQRSDEVWKACLPFIGNQAVLRNLASFTRRGMVKDLEFRQAVIRRIEGSTNLHPMKVLDALKAYSSGGTVGRSRNEPYSPNPQFIDALDRCLEKSFTRGVHATGQSVYIGLDVSGSMGSAISGSAVITCREAGAALALGIAKTEPNYEIVGFTSSVSRGYYAGRVSVGSTQLQHLGITSRSSFKDAVRAAEKADFGATDCALPMLDAIQRKLAVDTFIVITDNETWHGNVHPMAALKKYRQTMNKPNAKLAVFSMTATPFSIADPADKNTMDFVGFSADTPRALEIFMKS